MAGPAAFLHDEAARRHVLPDTADAIVQNFMHPTHPGSEGKTKRVMPPISKATGGLRPGIDLTRLSEIQGRDDLESMKRMKRFK